jgi:hypothetical protein
MPKFRVFLFSGPTSSEGTQQTWDLPWEVLVFDQRLDYQPEGASAPARFKVRRIRATPAGPVYEVAPDPGCLEGGDPKRDRP